MFSSFDVDVEFIKKTVSSFLFIARLKAFEPNSKRFMQEWATAAAMFNQLRQKKPVDTDGTNYPLGLFETR